MLSCCPVKRVRGTCCIHPADRKEVLRNNVRSLSDHIPSYSVRRLSYHFNNTVANIPQLYWILFIICDEWKYCAVFKWFISIKMENVIFLYWTFYRQLESKFRSVAHWLFSANFIHQTLCVIFRLNFPHTMHESEVIRLAGWGVGSIAFLQLLSMHKPSLAFLLVWIPE